MINQVTRVRVVADGLYWAVLYATLWLIFAQGRGWIAGTLAVSLAVALSLWLRLRPLRLRLLALPGFLAFFFQHMFIGAWDVARRALLPGATLQPAWHTYSVELASPRARLLLASLIGLLPGTLVARIEGDQLCMHILDERLAWRPTVSELERHLQQLLGGDSR